MQSAHLRAARHVLPHATRDTLERQRVRSRSRSRLGRGREAVSRPGPRPPREHRMQAHSQIQLARKHSRSARQTHPDRAYLLYLRRQCRSIQASRATSSSHRANAAGVETPTGGVTTTRCMIGRSRKGIHLFAAPDAQHGSANQKQRQVAAHFRRNAQLSSCGELRAQLALQAKHRRDRIRRRRAQTALHRQSLVNLDDDLGRAGLQARVQAISHLRGL